SALEFQRPFVHFGTGTGARLAPGGRKQAGRQVGAYVVFDTPGGEPVRVKAGISFVSAANALGNLSAEATSWNTHILARRARAAWDRLLGRVRVSGGAPTEQTIFYTALYHALLHPNAFSDANGQ